MRLPEQAIRWAQPISAREAVVVEMQDGGMVWLTYTYVLDAGWIARPATQDEIRLASTIEKERRL